MVESTFSIFLLQMRGEAKNNCIHNNLYLHMQINQQQACHHQQFFNCKRIHSQITQEKEKLSKKQLKLAPLIQYHKNFEPYEQGLKIIQTTPLPIFRINRKILHYPSKKDRVKTDFSPEQPTQPICRLYQKYITRSLQKRKLRPISLSPDSESQGQFQIINTKKKHIFFDPSDLLNKKIVRLPQRHQHIQKQYRLKMKQEKEMKIKQQLTQSSHPLQSKSLELPPKLERSNTDIENNAKLKDISIHVSLSKKNQVNFNNNNNKYRYNRRNQKEEDKGDKLTPWSFYNQYQH